MFLVDSGTDRSANGRLVLDALRKTYGIDPLNLSLSDARPKLAERRRIARQLARFAHTPEALIESWSAAQTICDRTDPGDVILIEDRGGVGGILALAESEVSDRRREVWTIAGDGIALETMITSGTIDHVEMPEASVVDWELVQYRTSAVVLASAGIVVETLRSFGVEAELVDISDQTIDVRDAASGSGIWVPGTVSRRNRSGEVLRGVASVPEVDITVSSEDAPDLIWSGTTWESLTGIRAVLGDRISRSDLPVEPPGSIILGDPLAVPDDSTRAWRSEGVPVIASRGSIASAMWAEAATWGSDAELAAGIGGVPQSADAPLSFWDGSPRRIHADDARTLKVSVGVPVFRNVAYLDECIASILNQVERPHEILIVDDGSASSGVDRALNAWAAREPDLIQVVTQPNRGVCVARNRMIDAMTGDAFVLVDQDDVLDPQFIRRTRQALQQDPSAWAVATWTEFFGEYAGIEAKPPFDHRVGLRENPIVSTAALVDMRVREQGVSFDPDLAFVFCEDWHYWSQIVAAGGRIGLIPAPLVRHRVHRTSGGFQRTALAHEIGKARAVEPLVRTHPRIAERP